MEDTLDVLKISRDVEAPPAKKKTRPKTKRPEGISREAYSLLDGSHPVVQTSPFKKRFVRKEGPNKKRKGDVSYTVSYRWKPFRNEAREDGLELRRWVKCFTDRQGNFREAGSTEYPFVKLNKAPDVLSFTDLEWERCLATLAPRWSREETLYLLELCRRFSLRFPVIHDRYAFRGHLGRSYDELREKYYSMAHALACFRSGDELPAKYLLKHPYDAVYERRRREACRRVMEMSWEEEWRDNAVLEQAERIEAQRLEEAIIAPSVSSEEASSDISLSQVLNGNEDLDSFPLHDSAGQPWRPEPGIYVRGLQTQSTLPAAVETEVQVIQELSVDTCFPTVCTKKLIKAWVDLRNEAVVLARLRKSIDADTTVKTSEPAI